MKKLIRPKVALDVHFNIAVKYGDANIALLYQNIVYWVAKNELNKTNFHDGKYWTYNTYDAFAEQYGFLSSRQIRRMLDTLEKDGYIVTGCYNTLKRDRTKWYSLGDVDPDK